MDLTNPTELKRLLQAHHLHLSKRFGQNFLVDRSHLMRVVETAEVGEGDHVFEIGPGVGTLTVELARLARRVACVELDRTILPALTSVMSAFPNATVTQADALRLDLPVFLREQFGDADSGVLPPVKVVANIPYNITSPLVVKLLEAHLFASITLMVQKEVALRLSALPDTQHYGSLTVFAQYYAQVSVAGIVPRGAFHPPPNVESAIVHLVPRPHPPVVVKSETAFFLTSRAAFGQRRKTLLNALTNAPTLGFSKPVVDAALQAAYIDGGRRGETLTLAELAALADALPFDNPPNEAVQSETG